MPEGTIVHSTNDTYGNILVVDYRRYRVLSFDSIYEQSGFNLEKPYALVHQYTRIMMLILGFIASRHFSTLMVCSGEYGNHILFACKSPSVDFERAPTKLKHMEKVLN